MEKLKYLSLIVFSLLIFASCDDNDPQEFLAQDSNVSFPTTTVSIGEESADVLRIPIAYACAKGGVPVTVTVVSSTEGQTSPAIEGEDYIIQNKQITFDSGAEVKYVVIEPIDNDVFTGRKTFNLVISSISPDLPQASVQNRVNVSILDNEHPWAAIIGNYSVEVYSMFDEDWLSIPAEITPTDDDTNVLALSLSGYPAPILFNVSEEDGEILLSATGGQYIGATPKPTGSWHPYFRATDYVEAEDELYVMKSFDGIFENGTVSFEYGFGVEAIHPATGASGGWFDIFYNGVEFIKKK
jgi:Calx-beta domain.